MAVVYPLMPVDNGASEVGAPNAMDASFYYAFRYIPQSMAGKYTAQIIC